MCKSRRGDQITRVKKQLISLVETVAPLNATRRREKVMRLVIKTGDDAGTDIGPYVEGRINLVGIQKTHNIPLRRMFQSRIVAADLKSDALNYKDLQSVIQYPVTLDLPD